MTCKNCNAEVLQNFCPNCGTSAKLTRINGPYIIHEIGSVLHFKKGILYSIQQLALRPGQCVNDFIHNDRNRLVKPILFIIITSLVYMIAQNIFHFEDGYVNAGGIKESATTKILSWIQHNYGYANIFMALFIAGWIKIFFRKYSFNFFEILVLLCFVMGIGMLIYTIFGIVESATHLRILNLGGIIGLAYASWAIGQFFDKDKKVNILKGLLSYILGMLTFFLSAMLLGTGISLIIGE